VKEKRGGNQKKKTPMSHPRPHGQGKKHLEDKKFANNPESGAGKNIKPKTPGKEGEFHKREKGTPRGDVPLHKPHRDNHSGRKKEERSLKSGSNFPKKKSSYHPNTK